MLPESNPGPREHYPPGQAGAVRLPAATLAVSCSSLWCSVALVTHAGAAFASECWSEPAGPMQSSRLLPMIDGLLATRALPVSALSLLVLDAGPGAFTALRVACSVVQGIALAVNAPVVCVGAVEALAFQAARELGAGRHRVMVTVDARMSEVYAAIVEVQIGSDASLVDVRELAPCIVGKPADVFPRLEALLGERDMTIGDSPLILAGDAHLRVPGLTALLLEQAAACGCLAQPSAVLDQVRADALASVGLLHERRGRAVDAALAAPRYVRDKVALDVDEQKALRARSPVRAGGV